MGFTNPEKNVLDIISLQPKVHFMKNTQTFIPLFVLFLNFLIKHTLEIDSLFLWLRYFFSLLHIKNDFVCIFKYLRRSIVFSHDSLLRLIVFSFLLFSGTLVVLILVLLLIIGLLHSKKLISLYDKLFNMSQHLFELVVSFSLLEQLFVFEVVESIGHTESNQVLIF